jgi:uncharacterized repeat protein (TIGR03803 family)
VKHRTTLIFLAAALFCSSARSTAQAQTNIYTVLYDFTVSLDASVTGGVPYGALVLSGNTLYGLTTPGGEGGTIFQINTDGSDFAYLFPNFGPNAFVMSGNTLYGTLENGALFSVNTDGSDFAVFGTNLNDSHPSGLSVSDNTVYGTTTYGGTGGYGTVYSVNTDGSDFTNLHDFSYSDVGFEPYGGVILSGNTLYGTTYMGVGAAGSIFAVNADGSDFTNLYSFTPAPTGTNGNGLYPEGGLILSSNVLYGTASSGGYEAAGTVYRVNTDGSGFKLLHSFTAASGSPYYTNSDGSSPQTGLLLSGNTLYGTTYEAGAYGSGTVFSVGTDGSNFVTLHTFAAIPGPAYTNSEGGFPLGSLIMSGNTLYGTAQAGGTGAQGTVFALTLFGPSIGMTASSNQVVLTWPASPSNYILQTAPSLTSGSWSNITSGIFTSGTSCVFTNGLTSQAAFFRLLQQ